MRRCYPSLSMYRIERQGGPVQNASSASSFRFFLPIPPSTPSDLRAIACSFFKAVTSIWSTASVLFVFAILPNALCAHQTPCITEKQPLSSQTHPSSESHKRPERTPTPCRQHAAPGQPQTCLLRAPSGGNPHR